jgi:hypothetical protein
MHQNALNKSKSIGMVLQKIKMLKVNFRDYAVHGFLRTKVNATQSKAHQD